MKPYTIFADSSGTLENPLDQAVSFVTVIASKEQVDKVYSQMNGLRNWVNNWGVDIRAKAFEFHTHLIFRGSGPWRNIGGDERLSGVLRILVLKKLKAIIESAHLPYVVVLIDKKESGSKRSGLKHFRHDVKSTEKKIMDTWGDTEERHKWEAQTPSEMKRKGFGQLGSLISLQFSYTNALMHELGYIGEAEIIADKQFVKQVGGYNVVLRMMETDLAERLLDQSGIQLSITKEHRQWQIKSLQEADSIDVWGIQLADFVAYTIRRLRQDASDRLARQIVVKKSKLYPLPKSLPTYEGDIYTGLYVNFYPH